MSNYHEYWGKTSHDENGQLTWHLLPYHCLDVAAVAQLWLERHPGLLRVLADELEIPQPLALRLLGLLAALHDIGKFADSFQAGVAEIQQALQGRTSERRSGLRHDHLGLLLLVDVLEPWRSAALAPLKIGKGAWQALVTAAACHHGKPCALEDRQHSAAPLGHAFLPADLAAAQEFAQAAAALFDVAAACQGPHKITESAARRGSWLIAGVVSLADWVASGGMDYRADEQTPDDYWGCAQGQALRLLEECGLLAPPVAPERNLAALFSLAAPSPLQEAAQNLVPIDGAQLYLLEDVTGAGKTEAALLLAQRLMARGLADGLYFALPTQATANAMYGRLAAVLGNFYQAGASLSLILAHAARELNPQFRRALLAAVNPEVATEGDTAPATVACNAWLADNAKKTFLADAGVGTLDQALLAILPSRFQSMRLAGLARRVLVVDEVHACDAYMLGLLERLLEFHAGLGGSVILLSATLAAAQRGKLVAAYVRGRGQAKPQLVSAAYPLLTRFPAPPEESETPLATRPEVARSVQVELLHHEDAAVAVLRLAAQAGQCACWVRNTVADALAAYDRLIAEPALQGRVMLFHARFAQTDRNRIEEAVLERFGKPGDGTRGGWILIATQVVEQSLDLDFDCMVSDLAPIDLLIQRAGRIHRHCRDLAGKLLAPGQPDQRGTPVLHLLTPPPLDAPANDWFTAFFPKVGKVYPNHGELWRSARLFRPGARSGWRMPADARDLIEAVFGKDGEPIPEGLAAKSNDAEGADLAEYNLSLKNALAFAPGYGGDAWEKWVDDKITPTRLGEASTAVALVRWTGERLEPWAGEGEYAWALSRLSIATRWLRSSEAPAWLDAEAWRVLTEQMPNHLVPLILRGDEQGWQGSALDGDGQPKEWRYHPQRGLEEVG